MLRFSIGSGIFSSACLILSAVFFVGAREGTVELRPDVVFSGKTCCLNEHGRGYAYYGIRYGKAERFEHSEENMDWSYIQNLSHPELGYVCPQNTSKEFMPNLERMSEDCLYLDVYVPPTDSRSVANSSAGFPVLIYIHGGGLESMSKDWFNGSSSLAADISAVVVVINYRLGALGFLSTGDEVSRGNYGIGDCKLAVRWVKKHIAKFGGDPGAVVVFGQSAGAGLTSALLLDKSVQDSIRAAAMFSGSVLTDVIYVRDPKAAAVALGKEVGCPNGSSLELVVCLKGKPLKDVVRYIPFTENTATVPYGFVVDNDHMKDVPLRALRAAASVSSEAVHILTGYLREDSLTLLEQAVLDIFDRQMPPSMDRIREVVSKMYLPGKEGGLASCFEPNSLVIDRIMARYNITSTDSREETLRKLSHLATQSQFAFGAAREALVYANHSRSSQLYRIAYSWSACGATHDMDVSHIFTTYSWLDRQIVNRFRGMMRQLAWNGRLDGPNFSETGQYIEMDQSGEWTAGDFDHLDMVRFWDDVTNTPCPNNTDDSTQSTL